MHLHLCQMQLQLCQMQVLNASASVNCKCQLQLQKYSATVNCNSIVDTLLSHGANVNAKDEVVIEINMMPK